MLRCEWSYYFDYWPFKHLQKYINYKCTSVNSYPKATEPKTHSSPASSSLIVEISIEMLNSSQRRLPSPIKLSSDSIKNVRTSNIRIFLNWQSPKILSFMWLSTWKSADNLKREISSWFHLTKGPNFLRTYSGGPLFYHKTKDTFTLRPKCWATLLTGK